MCRKRVILIKIVGAGGLRARGCPYSKEPTAEPSGAFADRTEWLHGRTARDLETRPANGWRETMPPVLSFDEAIKASKSGPITALLGNGFSIAQSGGQFGYANLLEYSGLEEDSLVRNVFSVLSTVDFEEVMHALEHASMIEEAYGETQRAKQFQADADVVRELLIHAVRTVHLGVHFEIPP